MKVRKITEFHCMCQRCSIALISSESKDSWSKFLPNIVVKYWIKHLAPSILMKTRAWRVTTITHSGVTYVFGPCIVHPSNIIYENWSCQSIIGLAACCIFFIIFGLGYREAQIYRETIHGEWPHHSSYSKLRAGSGHVLQRTNYCWNIFIFI